MNASLGCFGTVLYGLEGVSVLALISRQRQMASSLPAALYCWHEQDILEEIAWEDFGGVVAPGQDGPPELPEIDVSLARQLEEKDSKYFKLRDEYLRRLILQDPNEKVIIFAFFRGTLSVSTAPPGSRRLRNRPYHGKRQAITGTCAMRS